MLQVGGAPAGVGLGAVGERLRRRQELRRLEAVLEPSFERLTSRVRGRATERENTLVISGFVKSKVFRPVRFVFIINSNISKKGLTFAS